MKWKKRWGYEMALKATRKGIYRLKAGGFFVRARVTDATGRRRQVTAALHETVQINEAQRRLDELGDDARAEARGEVRTRTLWIDFAVSRLEGQMRRGKVASEATVEWWKSAIEVFRPEWGHLDVRDVTNAHIERWLNTKVALWMSEGRTVLKKRRREGKVVEVEVTTKLKPSYVNGWLRVLRTICRAAKVRFKLATSAFEGIEFFDIGRTYTREKPNALTSELLERFMHIARTRFPQHFAMILLGFVTGLRPSSIRPLRRRGPEADIDWDTGVLLVRRSHSRKQIVMDKTKTGTDNEITLPPSVLTVLREHVADLDRRKPIGPELASDLLFPGAGGGLRTRNILAKPFEAIGTELGISFRLTPRGMRRTFNDVCRAIGIHDVVTRSISGHQTEQMQVHYSTAGDAEQRSALAAVHKIADAGVRKGVSDDRVE